MVAADFNEDHKLDLLATVLDVSNTPSFYVLPGDGRGNFGAPQLAYAPPAGDSPSGLTLGDFDGDGHADIATLSSSLSTFPLSTCHGLSCPLTLHVLFGDGNLHFQDTAQATFPAGFGFAAADLNGDGISDLYGFARDYIGKNNEQTNKLLIYYGSKSGTMTLGYTLPAPGLETAGLGVGDFNGDGRMDIVTGGGECCLTYDRLVFFLANSSGGYTQVDHAIFCPDRAARPDRGSVQTQHKTRCGHHGESSTAITPTLIESVNTTASGFWGRCAYSPGARGLRFASPPRNRKDRRCTSVHRPNSYGQLRKIELWVDGKKVGEQYHAWENRAWFEQKIELMPGPHSAAFIRSDIDSRSQVRRFRFTVARCR